MEDITPTARLGVNDKRILFKHLIQMTDRILYLNKFPVDQYDFFLSLLPIEVERSIRILREFDPQSLTTTSTQEFKIPIDHIKTDKLPDSIGGRLKHDYINDGISLGAYPTDIANLPRNARISRIAFPHLSYSLQNKLELTPDNREGFYDPVVKWANKQIRLEEQLLRTAQVIKAIVHSCNTVGQYKRVSPELLTFLPQKYQMALKDYTKSSPYPAIMVEPKDVEKAMSTLAFASLQPAHPDEEDFSNYRFRYQYHSSYNISTFPRWGAYSLGRERSLGI